MSKGIGIVSLLGMLLLVGGIFANEAEVFLYVPTSFSEESFVSEEGEVSDVLDVLPG